MHKLHKNRDPELPGPQQKMGMDFWGSCVFLGCFNLIWHLVMVRSHGYVPLKQTHTGRLTHSACHIVVCQADKAAVSLLVVFHCCYPLHCINGYYIDTQEEHANLMLWEEDKQTTHLVSNVKSVCATTAVPSGPIEQMSHVPELTHID